VDPWEGVALGLVLGAAGWIRAYDFLEGEALLPDLWDEYRLRKLPFDQLEAEYEANANRSDVIMCLTTTPTRIEHLQLTLKSLLRQRRRPTEIRLHLPAYSRRDNQPYIRPQWLQRLTAVRIIECEDLGPATKLLPALLTSPPSQRVLAVDDDRIYPRNMVEDFDRFQMHYPDAALGMSGWVAPADLVDRPTTLVADLAGRPPTPIKSTRLRRPKAVDVLQGFSGYVMRPRFFDLDKLTDYSEAPPVARMVDDVWFSGHCNAPKFVIPTRRTNFQSWPLRSFYGRTSLGRLNRGDGDPERRSNTIMLQHFAGAWRVGGPDRTA
jgi:hypothetical protein